MKEKYLNPETEPIQLSVEEGACATISGTQQFTPQEGTWNTFNFS